jgi:hypothetical protein
MYLRMLQNHTSLKAMNIESQLRNISMAVIVNLYIGCKCTNYLKPR